MTDTKPLFIAVVDDDENHRRSLARLLRAAGMHPVTYRSAEALLRDYRHPDFDCLLLDIQLDGISGIELSRRLVAAGDKTPFIFLTAHDDPEVRAKAEAAGCAGYFRKSDLGIDVLEAIRQVVPWYSTEESME